MRYLVMGKADDGRMLIMAAPFPSRERAEGYLAFLSDALIRDWRPRVVELPDRAAARLFARQREASGRER